MALRSYVERVMGRAHRRWLAAVRRGHRRAGHDDLLRQASTWRRAGVRPSGRRPGAARADLPPARGDAQGARPVSCSSSATSCTRCPRAQVRRWATRSSTSTAASACCSATAARAGASCPTTPSSSTATPSRWARAASSSGQHVYTSRHGVAVQVNAFNFPVWGPLEKLAPAFLAGVPSLVKPASATAYLTARLVELVVESGLLPEGSLQLVCGSVGDLFDHLDEQDSVAFTGSASTAQRLRTHPNDRGPFRAVHLRGRLAELLDPRARRAPGTPEFDLFVKQLANEMTVKAGPEVHRDPPGHRPRRHCSTPWARPCPQGWPRSSSATRPTPPYGWARSRRSTSGKRYGAR